jgi:hypothetical protein
LNKKKRRNVIKKGVFVKNSNWNIIPKRTSVKETRIEKIIPVMSQLTQNAELLNPIISKLYCYLTTYFS